MEDKKPKKLLFTLLALLVPVAGVILGALIVLFTPLNRLLSRLKRKNIAEIDSDDNDEDE